MSVNNKRKIFVDTANLSLRDRSETKLQLVNIDPQIGTVRDLRIVYLRIANYILYYAGLIIKTQMNFDNIFYIQLKYKNRTI